MIELTNEMEEAARKLFKYKPVLLGLGLSTMLEKITDTQRVEYNGLLRVSGDERQAQVLVDYDRLYTMIKNVAASHELDPAPLFTKGHIDRTSLTYWSSNQVTILTINSIIIS